MNFNNEAEIISHAEIIYNDLIKKLSESKICSFCEMNNSTLLSKKENKYNCLECGYDFISNDFNLFTIINFRKEKWIIFLSSMIKSDPLEVLMRNLKIKESLIITYYELIYSNIQWKKYDLKILAAPLRKTYATFELFIN